MDSNSSLNQTRLQGLVGLFGISVASVAKVSNKSSTYVSRIVNGDSSLGTDEFYRAVEKGLGSLIEQRKATFFDFAGVDPEKLGTLK